MDINANWVDLGNDYALEVLDCGLSRLWDVRTRRCHLSMAIMLDLWRTMVYVWIGGEPWRQRQ